MLTAMDAYDELTTDELADPDYALPILRAYLVGGGLLGSGWSMALVNEIERLHKERDTEVDAAMRQLGMHLSHCNFGEHVGACKYGDADCPALAGWAWFGRAINRNQRSED